MRAVQYLGQASIETNAISFAHGAPAPPVLRGRRRRAPLRSSRAAPAHRAATAQSADPCARTRSRRHPPPADEPSRPPDGRGSSIPGRGAIDLGPGGSRDTDREPSSERRARAPDDRTHGVRRVERLSPTLAGVPQRCPGVELTFQLLGVGEQFEMLRAGEIHVGFFRLPTTDRSLTVQPLVREPLVISLPERHRLARRRSVSLRALRGERLLLFPRSHAPGYYDLLVAICRQARAGTDDRAGNAAPAHRAQSSRWAAVCFWRPSAWRVSTDQVSCAARCALRGTPRSEWPTIRRHRQCSRGPSSPSPTRCLQPAPARRPSALQGLPLRQLSVRAECLWKTHLHLKSCPTREGSHGGVWAAYGSTPGPGGRAWVAC
jgi:hypothetical protein